MSPKVTLRVKPYFENHFMGENLGRRVENEKDLKQGSLYFLILFFQKKN